MDYIAIFFGLLILVKGGDWLLKAAVALSINLSIPKIVIGMTVVSFATSAPELIVSVKSALMGHPDLAMGNVIGSNIANLALVLGIVILIEPIIVTKNFFRIDWPIMFLSTMIFYFFIKNNNLTINEGFILFTLLIAVLIFLLFFQKNNIVDDSSLVSEVSNKKVILLLFFGGGIALWLGSEMLIKGSVSLAQEIGISERIISISIISIGTSIPELSASLVAIFKKEKAISLGNLIGSNIFNILAVMGITAMIQPIVFFDENLIESDFLWMIFISVLILPLAYIPKRMKLGRFEGAILLCCYAIFIYQMFK
ncbi:MAG: calcium/sodium antiporter [Flavobacteriales bacterium]|jgi:cation:H+ antiporter